MKHTIQLTAEDYQFLSEQATMDGVSVDEYLSFVIDRERLIAKKRENPQTVAITKPRTDIEPPHRKWGM
ncbi:MAG: hypothetical protein NTU72_09670 [Fimbriimonadales bacterium]|nr:hypothetical protein [Fimbriimonadales bacterium]